MTIIPPAQKRFLENWDNPMAQGLISFINGNLCRPLSEVASWGIGVSEKRSRTFYIRFTDGTRISGTLQEAWQVAVFENEVTS